MTTGLFSVPLQGITRQARAIHLGHTLAVGIAAVLFALGWVLCRVGLLLWFLAAWTFVAVREGWRAARVGHGSRRAG